MANATTKHAQKTRDPNARALVGRKVLYIGNMTCPQCGLNRRKGMVSEFQQVFYCSEDCVLKTAG